MGGQIANKAAVGNKSKYSDSEHFRQLFTENAHSLFLFSFLLTADQEKAEQCFVAGLAECADGDSVFREWAQSWAMRVIARDAVRIIGPHPIPERPAFSAIQSTDEVRLATGLRDARLARVLALGDFERFVYVLSVLERHSDRDCAALLDTSRTEIREARLRAIQHIAEPDREAGPSEQLSVCAGI